MSFSLFISRLININKMDFLCTYLVLQKLFVNRNENRNGIFCTLEFELIACARASRLICTKQIFNFPFVMHSFTFTTCSKSVCTSMLCQPNRGMTDGERRGTSASRAARIRDNENQLFDV